VVTEWDWNTPTAYLHDEISSDRNNPNVNAHGLIYGSTEASSDYIPWLDPVDNKSGLLKTEYRDPRPDEQDGSDLCTVALLGNRSDLGQPHHGS